MVLENLHILLSALYLRGGPRPIEPPRRHWPAVEARLRAHSPRLEEAPKVLKELGCWQESLALEAPGLLAWAEANAHHCITPASPLYPRAWHRLGSSGPVALWVEGTLPEGPFLGLTGCRLAPGEALLFASSTAREGARLGYALMTGGAVGCDTAAEVSATQSEAPVVLLLPCGLAAPGARRTPLRGARLSLAAPGEPFTAGMAMARNALIFAASEVTVVASARYRQGGSWHGAADALRRRLGPVIARADANSPALRALQALGAVPLASASMLAPTLQLACQAFTSGARRQSSLWEETDLDFPSPLAAASP